jgi:hypothetical protein
MSGDTTNDADLALSILRNIAADHLSAIMIKPFERGGGHFVIDSSWVVGTDPEMDLLRRLRDEHP